MTSSKLRVLVVEDSMTVRRRLCEVIAGDPELELIAEADNGQRAIELCQRLRPDVISLDMDLPIMSGLSATEYIMAHCPTPILIVSASTNRRELYKTYDALAAGAVDVLEKPRGDESDATWNERYTAALKLVAKIRVITHPRARLGQRAQPPAARGSSLYNDPPRSALPATGQHLSALSLLAIGASTGGPSALVNVLAAIPAGLPLTILLVLHIDEPFGSAFAEWLSDQTPHAVRFARGGEPLDTGSGRALMAPPGRHLVLDGARFQLSDAPERHSCRPSIDVLFESLAQHAAPRCAAALLTGMGKDGASGLLALRQRGALTVAQDQDTSVVYGMPREAALLNAAEQILPLPQIGPFLTEAVSARTARHR